jgi:hypothetical protein
MYLIKTLSVKELEAILFDYFATTRPTLDEVYNWNIPEDVPFGFNRGIDSCARSNMRLRRFLRDLWTNEPGRRLDLAKWYVSVWGGIRANKPETIEKYVRLSETALAGSGSLQGVATWSKILAMRNPDNYAIYDARVSAALTAIQFANGVQNPILFPRVQSRNTKIIKFERWLSTLSLEKRKQTYGDYTSLLNAVAKKSGLISPEEVEMVLFANAETLVDQILEVSTVQTPSERLETSKWKE